jgi:hypothetical protein
VHMPEVKATRLTQSFDNIANEWRLQYGVLYKYYRRLAVRGEIHINHFH